jgi:hypothetical protein
MLLFLPLLSLCQEVRFNNNYSVACHNCYEKKLATNLREVFNYTKTIEIDIWNENFGLGLIARILGKSMDGNWYVKHKPQQRGNKNTVGGSFRDCLLEIKTWSDANPEHDVITIFIDKKQAWIREKGKGPADLDHLLLSVFSKNDIFTPADLLQDKASLKEAALTNWPPLDSLKGKFVFVITDGTFMNLRRPLNDYMNSQKEAAVCFVSPRIDNEKKIWKLKGFSEENAQNVVFYNLKDEHGNLAEKINALECITRVYGPAKRESYDYYEQMVNRKVNFVAFYNYKVPSKGEKGQNAVPKRKTEL